MKTVSKCYFVSKFTGNKTKGWMSKWVLQENKTRQIFRKRRAFFSCSTRFEIRPFALLTTGLPESFRLAHFMPPVSFYIPWKHHRNWIFYFIIDYWKRSVARNGLTEHLKLLKEAVSVKWSSLVKHKCLEAFPADLITVFKKTFAQTCHCRG